MDNSKQIEVQILNAFVDNNEGGNPAGVVLNADHLTNDQKLKIAKKKMGFQKLLLFQDQKLPALNWIFLPLPVKLLIAGMPPLQHSPIYHSQVLLKAHFLQKKRLTE
jgi:hypothetical protein